MDDDKKIFLPVGRYNFATTSTDNKVFFAGGVISESLPKFTNMVEILEILPE